MEVLMCGLRYYVAQEEIQANELMDPEDRPDFMPTAFDSLRQVCNPSVHQTPPPIFVCTRILWQQLWNRRNTIQAEGRKGLHSLVARLESNTCRR